MSCQCADPSPAPSDVRFYPCDETAMMPTTISISMVVMMAMTTTAGLQLTPPGLELDVEVRSHRAGYRGPVRRSWRTIPGPTRRSIPVVRKHVVGPRQELSIKGGLPRFHQLGRHVLCLIPSSVSGAPVGSFFLQSFAWEGVIRHTVEPRRSLRRFINNGVFWVSMERGR